MTVPAPPSRGPGVFRRRVMIHRENRCVAIPIEALPGWAHPARPCAGEWVSLRPWSTPLVMILRAMTTPQHWAAIAWAAKEGAFAVTRFRRIHLECTGPRRRGDLLAGGAAHFKSEPSR